jgi:hypothetical protein
VLEKRDAKKAHRSKEKAVVVEVGAVLEIQADPVHIA